MGVGGRSAPQDEQQCWEWMSASGTAGAESGSTVTVLVEVQQSEVVKVVQAINPCIVT